MDLFALHISFSEKYIGSHTRFFPAERYFKQNFTVQRMVGLNSAAIFIKFHCYLQLILLDQFISSEENAKPELIHMKRLWVARHILKNMSSNLFT